MGLFGSKNKSDANKAADLGQVSLADGTEHSVSQRVDCLGDSCPRPQLLTKKALGNAQPNDVVEVLVDNPTSMEALPPMCDKLSAQHLETQKGDRGWHVYIQKH